MVYRTASLKASEIKWESPCTKETCGLCVCALAHVLLPTRVLLGFGIPLLCAPVGALVPQCCGSHVRPWPGSGQSPLPRHHLLQNLQELAFFWNLHLVWKKSAIRSKDTEHHRLTALALFLKKMALKKGFHLFTQLEESINHRTATNFLSFFPYMMFLLQQIEFRTGSLNQIIFSHRKPLHVAHLIINISAPYFNKIMGTLLNLFNLKQLWIFSWLQLAFHKTKDMLMCLTKHWFNKRCSISFYKFHYAKGK